MHHGPSHHAQNRTAATTTTDGSPSHQPISEPTRTPGLLCLAASERDRGELAAILASSSIDRPRGEPVGLEALSAVSASRRAVLAGPDAVAAIVQGHATPPARGAAGAPMIDVMAFGGSPGAGTRGAGGPSMDGAPIHDGVMIGSARRRSDAAAGRVPTGPLAALATEHDRAVLASLTPRETEVAELVGSGANVGEIAANLGREKTTVISHRRSLLRKIGCRDALGIARFAYRTGLATP